MWYDPGAFDTCVARSGGSQNENWPRAKSESVAVTDWDDRVSARKLDGGIAKVGHDIPAVGAGKVQHIRVGVGDPLQFLGGLQVPFTLLEAAEALDETGHLGMLARQRPKALLVGGDAAVG